MLEGKCGQATMDILIIPYLEQKDLGLSTLNCQLLDLRLLRYSLPRILPESVSVARYLLLERY